VNLLKRQLSVANLLSCLALFLALGGAAYAATALTNKSVKSKHIAKGAVTTQKLANGAVTTKKLRNNSVSGTKVITEAISSRQLADGSVRSVDLGGSVVTEAKIKNGAVSEAKLGVGAVSPGKIQDGAVSAAKLSSSLAAQLVKNVSYVSKASATDAGDTKTVTAECPAGKQVTGGGARAVPATFVGFIYMVDSFPAVNIDGKRTGWSASAQEVATADPGTWTLEAFAICAEL
jgi:hypothetical protein